MDLGDNIIAMEYFFLTEKNLPDGVGVNMFGKEHVIWLATAVVTWIFMCLLARRLDAKRRMVMKRVISALIMLSELAREVVFFNAGFKVVEFLPLHMCGLAIFVVLWHALTQSMLAAELLYCLGMPGALCALLFPNWIEYPALNFLSMNSVFVHILLVGYPMILLATGEHKPDVKRLPRCLICLACAALPIYGFNKLTGMNYFFLNWPSPGSPLEFFGNLLGNPGYLLGFIPLLAGVWLLLYTPPTLRRRRAKKI